MHHPPNATDVRTSLFVGNGINRLSESAFSWADVLASLANACGRPDLAQGQSDKPFTLVFEEMVLCSTLAPDREDQLKTEVAKHASRIAPTGIHRRLRSLPVRHILTPNYDYALENAIGGRKTSANITRESRFSLFRRCECGDQSIWHIHGEAERPATITLGHDQYVGYLAKTKAYLTSGPSYVKGGGLCSPLLSGKQDFDVGQEPFSWVDLFLRDDIHMLGFGLDYSEIGIWWLITYKARLRAQAPRTPKGIAVGATYFYDIYPGTPSARDIARARMLGNMGVEVRRFDAGENYVNALSAYEAAVDSIQASIPQ